jgi:hypothetical protein
MFIRDSFLLCATAPLEPANLTACHSGLNAGTGRPVAQGDR